jgi:hypothetical protein
MFDIIKYKGNANQNISFYLTPARVAIIKKMNNSQAGASDSSL